ncbi:MAG: GTPase [Promethearchaeota archaeon]
MVIQLQSPKLKRYDEEEFLGLCNAANYEVIYSFKQKRKKINPKYFIGAGKIEEIKDFYNAYRELIINEPYLAKDPIKVLEERGFFNKNVENEEDIEEELSRLYDLERLGALNSGDIKTKKSKNSYRENRTKNKRLRKANKKYKSPDLVFIFNNRLNSRQIVNISELLKAKVIDRDLLILEIFELNARTKEAKLQIQLARINLEVSHKQRELSRQLKSERQGRDFMGKGYGAFDAYKRAFREQKRNIMDQLKKIRNDRDLRRTSRKNSFNVAIVGYTNAGKTTFLNTLKNSDFMTKDSAFTTTTTITRRFVYKGVEMTFTDTVGFVFDIPIQIIEAFLSTLEEARFSDCIILLISVAGPIQKIRVKLSTSFDVLSEIGAIERNIIYVLNKIDLIDEKELIRKKKEIKNFLNDSPKGGGKIFEISAKDIDTFRGLLDELAELGKNKTPNLF